MMLFSVYSQLLFSKNNTEYPENKDVKVVVDEELGEGSYGKVFKTTHYHAIKIFKNCTMGRVNLSLHEECLLPTNDENRELLFYFEMMRKNKNILQSSYHHVLQPYAIGYTKEDIFYKEKIEKYTYFVILPLCTPFYKKVPIKNMELLSIPKRNILFELLHIHTDSYSHSHLYDSHFGIYFVISVMKMLCKASLYLENEFKIYNLDFKINNMMFLTFDSENSLSRNQHVDFENLIVIDFGLIKHNPTVSTIFSYDDLIQQKYFIWPYSGTTLLYHIPSYSICINGLELLLGKKELEHLPSYRNMKRLLQKLKNIDYTLYSIFYEGLIQKCTTKRLYSFLEEYERTKK